METILFVFAGDSWQKTHLTYSLGGNTFVETDAARFASAFAAIAAVCGLTFERVADGADMPQIITNHEGLAANWPEQPSPYGTVDSKGYTGYHYGPGDERHDGIYDRVSFDNNPTNNYLAVHELLHGLGLEHPHTSIHGTTLLPGVREDVPSDPGSYGLNSVAYSVMSYNSHGAKVVGPMAFDIAALQHLYGANATTAAGNDTYTIGAQTWRCIWDTGGFDTIRYDGAANAVIDLRDATLQIAPGGGGYVSQVAGLNGGTTIAHGVAIECARGGSGDNILQGNELDNRLYGLGGSDKLYGSSGADWLSGGGGKDLLYCGSDLAQDRVFARSTDIVLQFDRGEDVIDLAGMGVRSVSVATIATGRYQVKVNTDADATIEHTFEVRGDRPGQSDFWY